jgi:hypothetical protein
MMPAMPPLQVSASSSASAKGGDGAFGGSTSAIQEGDWNTSFGSGGVTTSSNPLLYVAIAAGVWWLTRRKA